MEKTILRAALPKARQVREGDDVSVHYTGRILNDAIFDSSYDRGRPLNFMLGGGTVIKGWEQGLATMRVGEVLQLCVVVNLSVSCRVLHRAPEGCTRNLRHLDPPQRPLSSEHAQTRSLEHVSSEACIAGLVSNPIAGCAL